MMQLRLVESYYPPKGSTIYWIEYRQRWFWRYVEDSTTHRADQAREMFDRLKASSTVEPTTRIVATHP